MGRKHKGRSSPISSNAQVQVKNTGLEGPMSECDLGVLKKRVRVLHVLPDPLAFVAAYCCGGPCGLRVAGRPINNDSMRLTAEKRMSVF